MHAVDKWIICYSYVSDSWYLKLWAIWCTVRSLNSYFFSYSKPFIIFSCLPFFVYHFFLNFKHFWLPAEPKTSSLLLIWILMKWLVLLYFWIVIKILIISNLDRGTGSPISMVQIGCIISPHGWNKRSHLVDRSMWPTWMNLFFIFLFYVWLLLTLWIVVAAIFQAFQIMLYLITVNNSFYGSIINIHESVTF